MNPCTADIWDWLTQVPDPEIPVISIVDLGIVRNVRWEDDVLNVALTPTYSGCPATQVIAAQVEAKLRDRGIENLNVTTQLSPAWTTDWLTESGRKKLEQFGIAPPQSKGRPANCPNCGSQHLSKISQFGSTPCKALWRCDDCLEPFDYFKCI
jgi:ring-1,2-phenylacetyl-CoA epoxidase subunit PaaD